MIAALRTDALEHAAQCAASWLDLEVFDVVDKKVSPKLFIDIFSFRCYFVVHFYYVSAHLQGEGENFMKR